MKKEIIISGFGGQGGLAIGKNLAEAGMAEGLNVTWPPPTGRDAGRHRQLLCGALRQAGGLPGIRPSHGADRLNEPSLSKFEAGVVPGGMVFVNSDVVTDKVARPISPPITSPAPRSLTRWATPRSATW